MHIDPNSRPESIYRNPPAAPSAAHQPPPAADATEFTQASALNQALRSEPETRTEAVQRAAQLIQQPDWPSRGNLRQVAHLLASQWNDRHSG